MMLGNKIAGIHYTEGRALLEGVFIEGQRKENASKHPNVSLGVYFQLQIWIAHLRRSVGDRGFLVKLVNFVFVFALRDGPGSQTRLLEVYNVRSN